MKTILVLAALAIGCGNKGSSASSCADAVNKGVDAMMAAGAKRMADAPPELKSKLDEAGVKLKQVMTNRCTEDKWSPEVIACYKNASTREDLRACRTKLPPELAAKLQSEEMAVMQQMMGGMGMGGMHGHPGALGGSAAMAGSADVAAPPSNDLKAVRDQMTQLDPKIEAGIDKLGAAKTDADRTAAKTEIEANLKAKRTLEGKWPKSEDLEKLESQFDKALDTAATAKTDKDRKAAIQTLHDVQKNEADLEAKLLK